MNLAMIHLVVGTILSLFLYKHTNPYERGFDCNDMSIMKPYYPIIIKMPYLLTISFLIPVFFIVFIELKFKSEWKQIITKIKQLYTGLCITFILVLFCKVYFGRLRPNSVQGICNARHYCKEGVTYVSSFVCNNSVPKLVKESRMSFYSGHSSVGTFAAFYTILYVKYRFKSVPKLLFLIQFLVLILGLIPGYTQGINYWHHWSDIGTGYTVGAVTAYLVINYL